jgi:ComF family protein
MGIALFARLADLAADLLSPDRCAACARSVPQRSVFCPSCALSVVAAPQEDARHVAPFLFGGAVARAVVAFKYDRRAELARPLASLLRRGLPALAGYTPDVVVPVPLHQKRLFERGFNQSALLAGPAAHTLSARFAPRALVRTRDTPRQVELSRAARLANVEGAFEAREPWVLAGARVLLVDDVRTTGATLNACMRALRSGGAREVRTIVIASAWRAELNPG